MVRSCTKIQDNMCLHQGSGGACSCSSDFCNTALTKMIPNTKILTLSICLYVIIANFNFKKWCHAISKLENEPNESGLFTSDNVSTYKKKLNKIVWPNFAFAQLCSWISKNQFFANKVSSKNYKCSIQAENKLVKY